MALFAALLVSWWHDAAVVQARWHSVGAMSSVFLAYLIAVSVAIGLASAAAFSPNRKLPLVALALFCVIVTVSFYAAGVRAQRVLTDEIGACVASGVENDCKTVLARMADDPRLEHDGYIRIFPGSEEYDALPESIRSFQPVYVTIERRDDMPLNVGLCKNGFGGFHMGLRVFGRDPQIEPSARRERVAPSIYLWMDET